MAHFQAQDSFVAEIDGVPIVVVKGQVFPAAHPVVKLDAKRGLLFRPLQDDEVVTAPQKSRASAAKADG